MLNIVFTIDHEAFTYKKLDMRSCVYIKRYKPQTHLQTQQQNNMIVIVSHWDNSQTS